VHAALARVASPSRAAGAQAYMKSAMPFLGVAAGPLRQVCRRVFAPLTFPTAAAWRGAAFGLWRGARYREERYAAIELTGVRAADGYQDPDALPLYEEMIVTGAWWDYVDVLAKHRVGTLLRRHPRPLRKAMLRWSRDDDMWKRRTSILCQLAFKEETDLGLLYACIEPSLGSREFFLRKAIGWALRQYAWTDPREVKRYVREHERELSPLSRREALKNVSGART
jgi:3-methyladenine DNA glycosylase AlkD